MNRQKLRRACSATLVLAFIALFFGGYLPYKSCVYQEDFDYAHEGFHASRSSEWPKVRAEHLKRNPTCAACGVDGKRARLEVHHIQQFMVRPDLELDPTNLITLCRTGRSCHFYVGHDEDGDGPKKPNWKSCNKNVVRDSEKLLAKLNPK